MNIGDVEVHSAMAKRLWNVLRIAFFMMRKGLISKRKLIMDMNLMMKRGKILRKSLSNLMFHHHHHSKDATNYYSGGFGLHHYEFSCSNSPNPVVFHFAKRKHHHYFPCINPPHDDHDEVEEVGDANDKAVVAVVPQIEYSPDYSYSFRFATPDDLTPGEKLTSPLKSPFSVRISNFSSEDENDGKNRQVDDDAEEFIRRFYEQLRVQSRTQRLQ